MPPKWRKFSTAPSPPPGPPPPTPWGWVSSTELQTPRAGSKVQLKSDAFVRLPSPPPVDESVQLTGESSPPKQVQSPKSPTVANNALDGLL